MFRLRSFALLPDVMFRLIFLFCLREEDVAVDDKIWRHYKLTLSTIDNMDRRESVGRQMDEHIERPQFD